MSESDLESVDEDVDVDEDVGASLSDKDPADWTTDELAEQEWTLGKEDKVQRFQFKGMWFEVQDPDDDEDILNLMAEGELGVGDPSDRMYQFCKMAIVAPELTPEKWADMRTSERIGLLNRVSSALGLADVMDFQELGRQLQQAD